MNRLSVPYDYYSLRVSLLGALRANAKLLGHPQSVANEIFELIPVELREAPAFLCKLGNVWRYEYGEVIDRLPNDQIVLGTHQYPLVSQLYSGMIAAQKYLDQSEMGMLRERLARIGKHQDFLTELSPLVRLLPDISAIYESSGYGVGNKSIDWILKNDAGISLSLEVKYRTKDLVGGLKDIILALQKGEIVPRPTIDPADLFKGTFEKFLPQHDTRILQGVWISIVIKQDEAMLKNYFYNLDNTKIHFTILDNGGNEFYILTQPKIKKEVILSFFDLPESGCFF